MRPLAIGFLTLFLNICSVSVARAEWIMWHYTGEVTMVTWNWSSPPLISVGDPVSFVVGINTQAVNLDFDPNTGYYYPCGNGPIGSYGRYDGTYQLTIGGYSVGPQPQGLNVEVNCDHLGDVFGDFLLFRAVGLSFLGGYGQMFDVTFPNPNGTGPGSGVQPLIPPDPLNGWLGLWSDPATVYADFTSVEVVPEPASLLLFGTGLVGLTRACRKRRS